MDESKWSKVFSWKSGQARVNFHDTQKMLKLGNVDGPLPEKLHTIHVRPKFAKKGVSVVRHEFSSFW